MPSPLLAALIHCAHLVELAVHVGLLLAGAERDALERRPGHDDAVPGAGGAAGDELAAPVPLQVLLPGGHHLGLRVELEPFAGELLEHVVRDDDRGLADQAEPPQLGHAHDHLGGLSRADLVGQQHRGLADHPGDRRDLVRPGPEGQGQAGQGQRGVVVAAQHQAVEPVVVGAGQRGRAGRVLPGPVDEPFGQFGRFLLRGQRRVGVEDRTVPAVRIGDGVTDLDAALFQQGLRELRCRVAAGAPGGAGEHRVRVAADRPDLPAGMLDPQARVIEDLAQELLDVRRVDPCGAEPGVDLPRRQVGRDDPAQFGDVDREPGVVLGRPFGLPQLLADLAGQVLGGGHQPPGSRVVEHERAELGAGVVFGGAEQPGDLVQPRLAPGVQADGQRVGRGVGAEPRRARGDDPFAEDGRLGGPLADRVELLQGVDQRGERVGGEPALPWPDPGQDRLAGGRVGPAGAPQREPVQRPVGGEVVVVAAAEFGAQPGDLGRVLGRGRLGCQQGPRAVSQREQVSELGGLAGRYGMRLFSAEDDAGERAVRPGPQVPVGLGGPRSFGHHRTGWRRAPVRWQVGEAALPGRGNQCVQGGGERGDRVAVWADHQVVSPVGAVDGSHLAEHRVRVVQEVLVDRHLDAVQLGEPCLLPGGRVRRPAWFAAAQHEQVGDDAGARGALVGAAGQADRADQVGQRGDLPPRGRVAGVHREPGGEHRHQAAGPDQVQRLDDEVVVDAVPGRVVAAVVQHHVPERHVADRQVITALGVAAVGERLGADLGAGVEQARDARRHRVQLDPGHLGAAGREREEVPAAAARFEHPAAVEAQRPDRPPHLPDERGVGVVGVQRVPPGGRQLSRGQQDGELLARPGELGPAVVEHLRHRAPARPAGQHFLLGGRRGAAARAERRAGPTARRGWRGPG